MRRRVVEQRPPPARREPRALRNGYWDEIDDRSYDRTADSSLERFGSGPRKTFRLADTGRGTSFVLGMAAGVALTLLSVSVAGRIKGLILELDREIVAQPAGEAPASSVTTPAPAPPLAPASAPAAAPAPEPRKEDVASTAEKALSADAKTGTTMPIIEEKLGRYVGGLTRQLPIQIGADIQMVGARSVASTAILAFSISRVFADDEIAGLQATLEKRLQAGICNGEASEDMRTLNEGGATFRLVYSDLIGRKVAQLTMAPNFCSAAGSR